EEQEPRCAWISATSWVSSSPSSNACSVPSSRCDILPSVLGPAPLLRPVGFDQAAAGPGQRRADRPLGQAQRGGDLLVIEPLGPEQQRLAITLVERRQRGPHSGRILPPFQLHVRPVGRGLLLALKKLEPAAPSRGPAPVLAHQV